MDIYNPIKVLVFYSCSITTTMRDAVGKNKWRERLYPIEEICSHWINRHSETLLHLFSIHSHDSTLIV